MGDKVISILNQLPWVLVIGLCLTLGLAPFFPPHLFEKFWMLWRGELKKPIDVIDLIFHAAPWMLLAMKIVASRLPERA